jgi:predicted TIM-barrel fold metal-dependent hydrolase
VAYAREFPRLKIVVAHAGPGAPAPAAIEAATQADNIYLEFCSTYPTRGLVREAITRAGIEKILYGSDQLLIDPAYVLGAYQDAELTVEEWEQIAWRNPCRLFRLPMSLH